MKKLLMAGALSLVASLFANAETVVQLELPSSAQATKGSQYRGNVSAENILNKALAWEYGVYAGNNGGSSTWAGDEGQWTQDSLTSGHIALAGRNGTQGEAFALVLGNEVVAGTMFNSITFEVEIPANKNLDQKTFNLGLGYASGGSFQKTTTTSVTSSSSTSTTSTVTLMLDSLATWTSGDKIIVGVGGPAFSPVADTYQVNVKGVSIIPEPSAFGLLAGAGALALVASRRRRK